MILIYLRLLVVVYTLASTGGHPLMSFRILASTVACVVEGKVEEFVLDYIQYVLITLGYIGTH